MSGIFLYKSDNHFIVILFYFKFVHSHELHLFTLAMLQTKLEVKWKTVNTSPAVKDNTKEWLVQEDRIITS